MKGSVKSELRCCEALKRSQIKEEYVVSKRDTGRTNEMLKKVPHETQFPLEMVLIIISFHCF